MMMRKILPLLFALLPTIAVAQIQFHNADTNVTSYTGVAKNITFDGQCHWTVPNAGMTPIDFATNGIFHLMHTHAGLTGPMWGELGNQDVTLGVTIRLFQTSGFIPIIQGYYFGASGQQNIDVVMDQPGPYVGDPNGLVTYTGHMTINLGGQHLDSAGNDINLSKHGWVFIALFTRTFDGNGGQFDNFTEMPFFSVVDPSQPEPPLNEAGIETAIKCTNANPVGAQESDIFGIHLTEFRDQALANVLEQPFSTPQRIYVLGYNYGQDHNMDTSDNGGVYQMVYQPDFHMGVPGLLNDTIFGVTLPSGGTGNTDYIDPIKALSAPLPMGFSANQVRLAFMWSRYTGASGFIGQYGEQEPGNIELKSIATFTGTVGPNPIGCDPTLCPAIPTVTPPPPPPPTCTTGTPLFSVSPSNATLMPGGSTTFTITLTNTDSSACAARLFTPVVQIQ